MIDHRQTECIKEFLRTERFTDENLIDDLVDHLSCEIESVQANSKITFEEAFDLAKQKLLPNEPLQVQKDLEILTTKTQNIMIKKIAFIGGYASTVCLCLAILFFSQSLLGSKKSELKLNALQVEFSQIARTFSEPERQTELTERMNDEYNLNVIQSSNKFEQAELFLLISLAIFISTYLPYRFYTSFQKSQLELS